jgi:hypothetical protein
MIIGETFVWLHFPKCAGSFTENTLKKYFHSDPNISFDPIDPLNVIWHQNIAQREKSQHIDLSGKSIICNFRRLPYWIISRIRYEAARSGQSVPREMYIEGEFFMVDGKKSSAEKVLEKFTEREVKHWIRVEYLETDFYQAFSNFLDVRTVVKSSDFNEKINAAESVSHLDKWLNENEIGQLYESNPKWACLEKKLYGSLLTKM